MHRNAMARLIAWKDDLRRKPLIINGARQVGKTWLALEFGKTHFEQVAHVVFLDNEEMQRAFERSLNPDRLLTIIGAATGTNPQSGDVLVFLDEIQECPRALTSLKRFCEERPEIPVIAAGSLLGLALNRATDTAPNGASWPVGKVNYLDLHPMAFDEYLEALGQGQFADILRSGDMEMADAFHERLEEHLKTYMYVGGMPEAVTEYVESGDFERVRQVQTELINGYERDFAKHVPNPTTTERIRQTWKSVPRQLARESDMKRFTYAAIEEHARGRDYRDAVAWLIDAGLVTKVERISKPGIPLAGYADSSYFKLYLLDIGLLGAMTSLDASSIIMGNKLFTEYKGAYAEQYVCQQLVSTNSCVPYYWSADGKNKKGEVDFVVQNGASVLPVEVKAEENVRGSSIANFAKRYDIQKSVRFSAKPYKDQGWLVNVPLNMAEFLFKVPALRDGAM